MIVGCWTGAVHIYTILPVALRDRLVWYWLANWIDVLRSHARRELSQGSIWSERSISKASPTEFSLISRYGRFKEDELKEEIDLDTTYILSRELKLMNKFGGSSRITCVCSTVKKKLVLPSLLSDLTPPPSKPPSLNDSSDPDTVSPLNSQPYAPTVLQVLHNPASLRDTHFYYPISPDRFCLPTDVSPGDRDCPLLISQTNRARLWIPVVWVRWSLGRGVPPQREISSLWLDWCGWQDGL